jgi:hypothetical protein
MGAGPGLFGRPVASCVVALLLGRTFQVQLLICTRH